MLKIRTEKTPTRRLGVVVCVMLAAAPAIAGTVFSWRTEEGGYAFSDDEKSIPPRHRAEAVARRVESLRDYDRFTATDPVANDYREKLSQRLDRLRALNQPAVTPFTAAAANPRVRTSVSLRTGGEMAPSIELSPSDEGGPVVMEWQRFKPDGQITTRHNLIVRQGDKTLAIVKGRMEGETNAANNIRDESILEPNRR